MTHAQLVILSVILIFLIILSGFFSAAETALMSINRYRLRHKAQLRRRYAMLILKLLKRPDRLLGMVLIGNTFANVIASALATLLAAHFWGDRGVVISSILLTLIILIFSEVTPKTMAALYSDQVSKIIVWPVSIMIKVFYPLVWLINMIANTLLKLMGLKMTNHLIEPLSREELRSVVFETSSRISRDYQKMVLGILDLNKVTVDDVLIPQHEIIGIDIELPWEQIQKQLSQSEYDWLPVYRDQVNQLLGVLHLRELMHLSLTNEFQKSTLLKILHEPYFVPEKTPLNIQLMNFQRLRKRIAFVVDEYGEVKGLITMVDILEEIVGEFTTTIASTHQLVIKQADGSYLVDGSITIRELNRQTTWQLPTQRTRTLSGLIIDYLESIPKIGLCVKIGNYPIEILEVKKNRVKLARVFLSET